MKRKSFVAVACAAAMIASMTSGLTVFAEETADFSGEELSILVSAGWMDNRYDATIERFEDTYGVTVDLQTIRLTSILTCFSPNWLLIPVQIFSGFSPTHLQSSLQSLIQRNTVLISQELPGKILCRKQEKHPVYTMINYTDFRSGTIHQNM